MASTSGIRASGSEYVKKIILKDAASYGPWRAKITSILDAEDCWEIIEGGEVEPDRVALRDDNKEEVEKRLAEIKDFKKRTKKAASVITQSLDDSIVMGLDVHNRDPIAMWNQLAEDYNTVTPAQKSAARKEFMNLTVSESETYLDIKQKFNELLRKVTVQGGVIDEADQLDTLLNAPPQKYDMMREAYFSQDPVPDIDYVWDRMYDIESTEKRRAVQYEASAFGGEGYQGARGRGNFGGRGRERRT